jgi:hypothetical protein
MRGTKVELINCHDCGKAVSFSAAKCPHCGSAEPAGPYVFNRKEARRHRIEERNDRNLMIVALSCGLVGAAFGAADSSSTLGAILGGIGYGFLGLLAGVPIAFVINMTRHLSG